MLSLVVMSTSFALIVKECLGGEEKVDLLKKKKFVPHICANADIKR